MENNCSPLPSELLSGYEPLECLSHSAQAETFLVKDKENSILLVAKLYEKASFSVDTGERIFLARLNHPAIPKLIDSIETPDSVCIIREYVKGTPLNKADIPFDIQKTRDIGIQLCDVLTYLHNQSPSIIHRDIKPQNIILDNEGRVHLIDFGISRHFNDTTQNDTVYIGTKGYAPPEQYGFKQTDARTDIYSLGVLLNFLLTGKTELDERTAPQKRAMHRVLRKCTAFAPENRYQTASAVKKAFLGMGNYRVTRIATAIAIFLFLILTIGITANQLTTIPPTESQAIVFQEPLIERAVRTVLELDDNTAITEHDLLRVNQLYISGNRVYASKNAFLDDLWGNRQSTTVYTYPLIETLDDLIMMPNIKYFLVANQRIRSIEPISHLSHLVEFSFHNTPVSDLSPLRFLQSLEDVHMDRMPVRDLSPLLDLPRLNELGLHDLLVTDPTPLREITSVRSLYITNERAKMYRNLPDVPLSKLNLYTSDFDSFNWIEQYETSLQYLTLHNTRLTSLAGIERFANLEYIEIINSLFDDLTPLLSLPRLQTVMIDASMLASAESIKDMAGFEIILN
jgi:serine/threonine protein kinase